MQKWTRSIPVKQIDPEQAKTAWIRLNQFTPDPGGFDPFESAPTRSSARALDATPVTELIRTEWFTSLVNSGVRACATFQVDLGVIHFDTPKVCTTAADLASAFAWLLSGLVGAAESNGTMVKGMSKTSIDALTLQLAAARLSPAMPA